MHGAVATCNESVAMKYEIEIEAYVVGTSVGMKQYVGANTIAVLQKRATALLKQKIKDLKELHIKE